MFFFSKYTFLSLTFLSTMKCKYYSNKYYCQIFQCLQFLTFNRLQIKIRLKNPKILVLKNAISNGLTFFQEKHSCISDKKGGCRIWRTIVCHDKPNSCDVAIGFIRTEKSEMTN